MSLITESAEIKDSIVAVIKQFDVDSLMPKLPSIEKKYIKRILGTTLYTELCAFYTNEQSGGSGSGSGSGSASKMPELLRLCQVAIANIAFAESIPGLSVMVGNEGITVYKDDNNLVAGDSKIDKLIASVMADGMNAIDEILEYLEENINYFQSWKTSPAYTLSHEMLVFTTAQVDNIYSINGSRLVFLNLRQYLRIVQDFSIRKLIGDEFLTLLITQIRSANISAANKLVLDLLQKAMVWGGIAEFAQAKKGKITDQGLFFAVADSMDQNYIVTKPVDDVTCLVQTGKINATRYEQEALSLLRKNPHDYPVYYNSPAYTNSVKHRKDNTGKKIFVVGM